MGRDINLFTGTKIGSLDLKNRIVLAPMTRSRAKGNISGALAPLYYTQRSSAGLLITEASQISPQGIGYIDTPGIHSEEQVSAWKNVTDAVHNAGSKIFIQLWHVGRVSHPDFHNGALPVAPSAIGFEGEAFTQNGRQQTVTPRALLLEEIKGIVDDYRRATVNAKRAGFDGVEIHGANSYLPDQFLQDVSNHRTDEYGGSIENRSRFLLEIVDAAIGAWDRTRVGVRLSPLSKWNGMGDSNPDALFGYVIGQLANRKIAYLHLVGDTDGRFAKHFVSGVVINNGGYDREKADRSLQLGHADLIAFGVPFLANPDLPERLRHGYALNKADPATFYGGGAQGYTDYPTYLETGSMGK